jgi:thiol-disulfide isomerase/thioredoxin
LVLFVVAIVFAALRTQAPDELGADDPLVGQVAPDFDLPVLAMTAGAGVPVTDSLANHVGEVVLLDFWATTCAPCRRSIPLIERLAARYDIVVLSINVDYPGETRDDLVRAFALQTHLESTILIDNGNTAYEYDARRIPLLVMIDRGGTIGRVYRGFTEYGVLADGVEALLEG